MHLRYGWVANSFWRSLPTCGPKVPLFASPCRIRGADVHVDPGPHGGGDHHLLHVEALHCGRLHLHQFLQECIHIGLQVRNVEIGLANWAMDCACLVRAVLHLSSLCISNRLF
eukprot:EG_transcript_38786